jgi:hypothetical protein
MIWFTCAQCGKRHGRPESAVGSVVFCECGHGNRVPWESTAPAPEPEAAVPALVLPPEPPPLAAVPVGEERVPAAPPRPAGRRGRARRRDPALCFNHQEVPSEVTCAACEEHFCRQCVIEMDGKALCGPCKNYQFRVRTRPPRVSGLAIAAVLVALVAGCMALLVVLVAAAAGANPVVLVAIAVAPQLLAGLLAALALHTTATSPKVGGQSLAVTALVTAVVSSLVLGALGLLNSMQWV